MADREANADLHQGNIDGDHTQIVNVLANMFGNALNMDALHTIVESCEANLNNSIDAVMKIVNSEDSADSSNSTGNVTLPPPEANPPLQNNQPSTPRRPAPQNRPNVAGAVPKINNVRNAQQTNIRDNISISQEQVNRILDNHNKGYRILIILRGVPGSGKTYLGRKILEVCLGPDQTNYYNFICSSDDYFIHGGRYLFDSSKLSLAHNWNQKRVFQLMASGASPIIVDNTNIRLWEMEIYIKFGINEGYIIEVAEPRVAWHNNINMLARKNVHEVPFNSIKRMMVSYEKCDNAEQLIKYFGLKPNAKPSIRLMPAVTQNNTTEANNTKTPMETTPGNKPNQQSHEIDPPAEQSPSYVPNKVLEMQMIMEEFERVEAEWEKGDKMCGDVTIPPTEMESLTLALPPASQREFQPSRKLPHDQANLVPEELLDWTKFLTPWGQGPATEAAQAKEPEILIETKSSGTCIELGDTDVTLNNHKIITSSPRNINQFSVEGTQKIPVKRMLDKSTETNVDMIGPKHRCGSEEQHFQLFRKMFKNIPRADLRDIFDKCCGDVNWAAEIVIEGVSNNQFESLPDCESDEEEADAGKCDCAAMYGIVPNTVAPLESVEEVDESKEEKEESPTTKEPKKTKPSENLEIKRQIEQNFVIPDEHYSPHCLKIKKWRHGDTEKSQKNNNDTPVAGPSQAADEYIDSSDDESEGDNTEETRTVNLGKDFINQLDTFFGRNDSSYDGNIVPFINMPISMIDKMNALWLESLLYQLQSQHAYTQILMKQDEDFARQLAQKQEEMQQEGQEPKVPDFKEIMDMDLALSIYQKDSQEWRNNLPGDMAAVMTRDKLFKLFPDVSQEDLTELLVAHDNNFQSTVEAILISTGQSNILEQENGVNKFVVEKEMERQQQLLEEKNLSEEEWPALNHDKNVTMDTVKSYRNDAQRHLDARNRVFQFAQANMTRGMTEAAAYYSNLAKFHKRKYDHANFLAATSLIQLNSGNHDSTALDLHYLYVSEALETLDIFLDHHIQLAQKKNNKNKEEGNHRITPTVLFIITGRGLHSPNGPRVRPAVTRRLKQRGLSCQRTNPGLLTTSVYYNTKLTNEL